MVDNVVPTLAPQSSAPAAPSIPKVSPLSTDKEALFASIAQESIQEEEATEGSFQSYFTAFLWFGYAVAIVVALVLVWSATKELIGVVPH
jgi:hypothetical protein